MRNTGESKKLLWGTSSGLIRTILSLIRDKRKDERDVSLACGFWPQETHMRWAGRGDRPLITLEWVINVVGGEILLDLPNEDPIKVPLATPTDRNLQTAQAWLSRTMGGKFDGLIHKTLDRLAVPVVHQSPITAQTFADLARHAVASRGLTDHRQIMAITGCTEEYAERLFAGRAQTSAALHVHRILTHLGVSVRMKIDSIDAAKLLPAQMPSESELQLIHQKVEKADKAASISGRKWDKLARRGAHGGEIREKTNVSRVIELLKERLPVTRIATTTGYTRWAIYKIATREGIPTARQHRELDKSEMAQHFLVHHRIKKDL